MYIAFPETVLTVRGSDFVAAEWTNACEVSGIQLRHTGRESYNHLGVQEKYHSTLRTISNKLHKEHSTFLADLFLALYVKAMNYCIGTDGLVPSLLFFGVIPSLPDISPRDLPSQKELVRAIFNAQKTYERLVSQARASLSLQKRPPPAAVAQIVPADLFYVYRERIKAFPGPHLVAEVDIKQAGVHVCDVTGPRAFGFSQIKIFPLQLVVPRF